MSLKNLLTLLLLIALCHVAVNFTLLVGDDELEGSDKQGFSVKGTETIIDGKDNFGNQ
jgi:hypothetical protein